MQGVREHNKMGSRYSLGCPLKVVEQRNAGHKKTNNKRLENATGDESQSYRRRVAALQSASRDYGPIVQEGIGPLKKRLETASATRTAAASAATAAALASLVAIAAEYRAIATRLKWDCCRLTATRTNHRSSLCRSRTVAGAPLIVFLCLTAILATFRGRITTFLKERLIRSGEGEVLPAIAARKLNISGHGSPRGNCTAQCAFCVQGFC
jgi:hypothetical protein